MDYKKVIDYCKDNYIEEVKNTLYYADLLLKNKFYLQNNFNEETHTGPAFFSQNKIEWLKSQTKDPEFIWELNRHYFFIYLGRAYCLTGEKKYVIKFKELIANWIKSVRLEDDPFHKKAWRPLDVGIRIKNWLVAFDYMREELIKDNDFIALFNASLQVHKQYLIKFFVEKNKLSNWGVLQNHGLFCLCCYLGEKDLGKGDLSIAYKRLCLMLDAQIMNDGTHWEQSFNYHWEMVNCFVLSIAFAQRYDIILPEDFINQIKKMAKVLLASIKPNRCMPLTGDTDVTNIKNDFAKYAIIFNDGEFKYFACNEVGFENLWLFGDNCVEKYKSLEAIIPQKQNFFLEDSGNYYLRTDWSESANFLHFINGYTGKGHSHADKLHFDLDINGKEFFVDSGRYSYCFYNLKRRFIKSSKAHNTIRLNYKDFIIYDITNWGFYKKAPSIKIPYIDEDEFTILQGTHIGYLKNILGGVITRTIIWLKPDIYIISDLVNGKNIYTVQRHFNLHPLVCVKKVGNNYELKRDEVTAKMQFFGKSFVSIKKGLYSSQYGKLEKNNKIVESSLHMFNSNSICFIDASNKATIQKNTVYHKGKRMKDKDALSFKITYAKDTYDIILCNKELMKYVSIGEDIGGAGRIIIYKNGKKRAIYW